MAGKDYFKMCNNKGWIPGPDEDLGTFQKRVDLLIHFDSHPPEDVDHFLTDPDWDQAKLITQILYDFSPNWIVAHYSDKNLTFFQGAATWITEKEGVPIPLIQLREKLETGKMTALYKREEVLAHEMVHAARMAFDEPIFEEIFAYKTSPFFWRRFFGPLFQNPTESYIFLGLALLPLIFELVPHLPSGLYIPLIYLGFLLLRLGVFRLTLFMAMRRLSHFLKDPEKKLAVALRLKDSEIFRFAYTSRRSLAIYIAQEMSLRFQQLKDIYVNAK